MNGSFCHVQGEPDIDTLIYLVQRFCSGRREVHRRDYLFCSCPKMYHLSQSMLV
jgi:hypothetical protein